MDAPPPAQPDATAPPPSSTSASAPPSAPPANPAPPASMAAPSTSESTPAPTSAPTPTPGPVQTLETPTPNPAATRPPPPRMRPPYGNLAAPIAFPPSAALTAASSSSASVPASSVASAMPRAVTIGLPAQPRGAPVGYSGFMPPPPLSQQFGSMHRGPDQTLQSSAQLRQAAPGIQNTGMVGSLNASQTRPPAISGPQPPRPGLPSSTPSPSGNQMPGSLKTPVHALTRPLSATAPSTSSPQSLSNAHLPFRPQQRPQIPQPRPHHVPQSAPMASNQQNVLSLQQQVSQNQHVRQQQQHGQSQQPLQQNTTHKNQQQIPQQQAPRIPVSIDRASINTDASESGNRLLSKRSIHDLVAQIDPSEQLDPEVEDVLIDIAEDFVESVATFACSLAKHRKSNSLEAKDVLLHAERSWNITLPGLGGDEIKLYKKPHVNDIHRERLTLIKKSMASEGNKAAQASANQKNQTPKPSAPGSP